MSRKSRQLSNSGIYHILIQGYNKTEIFKNACDKEIFITALYNYALQKDFNIYAYCIMDNHAHLVIWVSENNLSALMKEITKKYAYYLNNKQSKTGRVFHDRFKSEPIEDAESLLSILAFIHNTPVKSNNTSNYKFMNCTDSISTHKIILNEEAAKIFIKDYLESRNETLESIKTNWELRYALVRDLKEKSTLSIRKIACLLLLTRGIVQNIK
jgi:putative transposase